MNGDCATIAVDAGFLGAGNEWRPEVGVLLGKTSNRLLVVLVWPVQVGNAIGIAGQCKVQVAGWLHRRQGVHRIGSVHGRLKTDTALRWICRFGRHFTRECAEGRHRIAITVSGVFRIDVVVAADFIRTGSVQDLGFRGSACLDGVARTGQGRCIG